MEFLANKTFHFCFEGGEQLKSTEAYLQLTQKYIMKLFCKNS